MQIEYEVTFPNIDKDDIRSRLKKTGAKLIKPEFMQKRVTFNPPKGFDRDHAWLRVRDEGDKIILTYKIVDGDRIDDQKEINIEVDNFNATVQFLETIGCQKKSYQETKRELWQLDNTEVMIDEWPYLEPFVEVEGENEIAVRACCKKLELDYSKGLFCSITKLYHDKYKISEDTINNHTPRITFEDSNPFV